MSDVLDRMLKLGVPQRIGIVVVLYLLIVAGFYFGLYVPLSEEYEVVKQKNGELIAEKNRTQAIADDLESFRLEVEKLNDQLTKALRALPNQRSFDTLMTRMENLAKRINLEVILLEPRKDVFRDFYAEVPFKMQLQGTYHEVAVFFFRLGTMARIVNVEDIVMDRPEEKGGRSILTTTATAVTYRFLDEAERLAAKAAKGPKGKKGRRK